MTAPEKILVVVNTWKPLRVSRSWMRLAVSKPPSRRSKVSRLLCLVLLLTGYGILDQP